MEINEVNAVCEKVIGEVEKAVVGKRQVLRKIMAAILADGHILLEDYPGLAKTLIANCFATALGLDFKRIQFTPDLLPGDITGGYVFNRTSNSFDLRKGPIFSNIILADEINRASPKTQSALLEAMQERQVTIEGETMKLPEPFIVIATQNPIESEGTFPLPEAQLDRFLMKLSIGYPSVDEEVEILTRRKDRKTDEFKLSAVTNQSELTQIRETLETIFVETDITRYAVELVAATRKNARVTLGASPRAGLALLKLIRAWAVIEGRDYVLPDDLKHFAYPTLNHRLILVPDLWAKADAVETVIQSILDSVPVPMMKEA